MSLASLHNAVKDYGARRALDHVDLTVREGEILGLLGPNGAGKTTILSVLTGTRTLTSGTAALLGGDPTDPGRRVGLGVTPQETSLPRLLRVGETLDLVSSYFPASAVATCVERFSLEPLLDRRTAELSGGQQRLVAVAIALVGRPSLVVLDEPTTGLDVTTRRQVWDAIRAFRDTGVTFIVTSHYIEEIEELASRVCILADGRVLADGSTADVIALDSTAVVTFTSQQQPDARALAGVRGVTRVPGTRGRWRLTCSSGDDAVRALVASDIEFHDLQVRPETLEGAFLTLTGNAAPASEGQHR